MRECLIPSYTLLSVEVLSRTRLAKVILLCDRLLANLDGSRAPAIRIRHRIDRVSGLVGCLRLFFQAVDKTVREENTF